ncbi:MAG: DUF1080 domain-containing protein [Phycisphaeraceae bacterium]
MKLAIRSFLIAVVLPIASLAQAEAPKAVALFDGKTLTGWVTGGGKPVTQGWVVEDGTLHRADKGGDIFTEKEYTDFILEFEWKISEAGNSGVKYRFGKYGNSSIGAEYQVLDDDKHPDGKVGKRRQSGSLYDVIEPNDEKKLNAVGQWNHAKIVVKGTKIEHWVNGKKVIDIDLTSDEWKSALAKSKFKGAPDFATKAGKIMLQDHGNKVWFRNLKITDLGEK